MIDCEAYTYTYTYTYTYLSSEIEGLFWPDSS